MTSCELPLIRVSNPGDLIETVPYLMGFHPTESLAFVGFTNDPAGRLQRVTVTMRVDLPAEPDQLSVLAPLAEAFETSRTDSVVVIAHTERISGDPRAMPELRALQELVVEDLRSMGLQVLDVLVASATRWWSMCCDRPECCPVQGTPRRPDSSAVAAQATYAGLVALPDRQALAATMTGASSAERAGLEPLLTAAADRVRAAVDNGTSRRVLRGDLAAILKTARRYPAELATVPDRQLARFAVALTEVDVRDAVWLAIDDRSVDATALTYLLHTRLPAGYAVAPLFLYGWGQWRAGNGTLAMMAAEQALASDPAYSAAQLLIGAVRRGLDPRTTPALSQLSGGGRRRAAPV